MSYPLPALKFDCAPSLKKFFRPTLGIMQNVPELKSRGNRPLKMNFEDQFKALIYFHLEGFESGCQLVQILQQDNFAKDHIAPADGISKSSFFEAINERGLEQFIDVFQNLNKQAQGLITNKFSELGDLVAIDGSLIDSVLSMTWADYQEGSKKAKVHLGFNINRSIPQKFYLTEGKGAERPFVERILEPGQTGVMDRGYQSHSLFDQWQTQGIHFICRIKGNTKKTCVKELPITDVKTIYYDAIVRLGQPGINQTEQELRLVGYKIGNKKYLVATDRLDLTATQLALAYKLRWNVETFFAWWKRQLHVYHLISRSKHGLKIQILAGLITYLLLAIYCHEEHGEKVTIKRVRELRIQIENELRKSFRNIDKCGDDKNFRVNLQSHASP